MVHQLPEDGAIAPKHDGGLINYRTVYVVCAFVGLMKNIKVTTHVCRNKSYAYYEADHLLIGVQILNVSSER